MLASMLPAEIWLHIFEQLCPHCGTKEMPDFSPPAVKQEDSEYERGKSALAALCLTSRDIRDLSQPVLYHCFYDYPHRNSMSKFLRTLISQPRLAGLVKVLSLPENKYDHVEYNTRDEVEVWNKVSYSLGIPPPRWIPGLLSGDAPAESVAFDGTGQNSRLRYLSTEPEPYLCALRSWQHCLTVGLCSTSLTHLAVFDMYGPCHNSKRLLEDFLGPSQPPEKPFHFPHLRVFSCFKCLFWQELTSFVSQAPLLDHVAASRISCPRPNSANWVPPKLTANLQSMSFGCVSKYFKDIIGTCEHVQDLEVYLYCPEWDWDFDKQPIPDPWPLSVKQQVRRLCWGLNDFDGWEFIVEDGRNFIPPIEEFQNLEILEIDRESLHTYVELRLGPNTSRDEAARQVPTILPPSIRILHLSSEMCLHVTSWSTLIIELEALAAAKKTTLRRLSVIRIDEWRWELRGLPDFMEKVGVVSAMRDVGIMLEFGIELGGYEADRGMLPPLLGNLEYLRGGDRCIYPVNHFALED